LLNITRLFTPLLNACPFTHHTHPLRYPDACTPLRLPHLRCYTDGCCLPAGLPHVTHTFTTARTPVTCRAAVPHWLRRAVYGRTVTFHRFAPFPLYGRVLRTVLHTLGCSYRTTLRCWRHYALPPAVCCRHYCHALVACLRSRLLRILRCHSPRALHVRITVGLRFYAQQPHTVLPVTVTVTAPPYCSPYTAHTHVTVGWLDYTPDAFTHRLPRWFLLILYTGCWLRLDAAPPFAAHTARTRLPAPVRLVGWLLFRLHVGYRYPRYGYTRSTLRLPVTHCVWMRVYRIRTVGLLPVDALRITRFAARLVCCGLRWIHRSRFMHRATVLYRTLDSPYSSPRWLPYTRLIRTLPHGYGYAHTFGAVTPRFTTPRLLPRIDLDYRIPR